MTGWAAALDDFERTLEAQRAALQAGVPEGAPSFTTPRGLGPLPVELQDRASALLVDATAMNEQLATAVAAVQRELGLLGRMRLSARRTSSYVDSSL